MLKIQEIREIIKLIDQSDIEEFSYEHEGSKVEMKKRSNSLVSVQAVSAPEIQQPIQVQTALVNDVSTGFSSNGGGDPTHSRRQIIT